MLLEKNNFSLARFPNLQSVDWVAAENADILQIGGLVPGGIYHSEHMIWRGDLTGLLQAEDFIKSKRERKSVAKAQEYFSEQGLRIRTIPLTETLFAEFKKLYDDTTMVRERPIRFDLESLVLGKMRVGQTVHLIGLFDDKQLISGLLFSVFGDKVSVSFGAKRKFPVRGGAGGIFEYELVKFCLEHGYTDVTHGTATNPSGLHTQAGVFEFKARYGYSAYPMGQWYSTFIQDAQAAISDFVFVGMIDGQIGYTVVSNGDAKDLTQKYATRGISTVQILTTNQVQKKYKNVLNLSKLT